MGKKKRAGLAALGAAVALLFGVTPAWGECLVSGSDYTVGAKAAVVMEAQTGTLLFAQEAHKKMPMASTTKIMTALLTLEQEGLDETFTVDPVAIQVEGSSMGLQEGDAVTLRALAGGMLTASGNDAAGAAAVRIDGSKEAFVQRMNRRAQELGMLETHFVTPSGLDAEEHYSTAYDMALLGRAALQNPVFAEMAGQKRLALTYGNPPYRRSLLNHNRLLSLYPDAIGIKTGFTKKGGTLPGLRRPAGRGDPHCGDPELRRRLEHPYGPLRAVFPHGHSPGAAPPGGDYPAGNRRGGPGGAPSGHRKPGAGPGAGAGGED